MARVALLTISPASRNNVIRALSCFQLLNECYRLFHPICCLLFNYVYWDKTQCVINFTAGSNQRLLMIIPGGTPTNQSNMACPIGTTLSSPRPPQLYLCRQEGRGILVHFASSGSWTKWSGNQEPACSSWWDSNSWYWFSQSTQVSILILFQSW